MVVALGAGESHAEKHLGRILRPLKNIPVRPEVIGRRVPVRAAAGGQDFPGKDIEGFPRGDTLANPALENLHSFSIENLLLITQQIAPFQRPEISEASGREQLVNLARSLSGLLSRDECSGLIRGGQPTGKVKGRAAQEDRIVADHRRIQAQAPELTEDGLIDKILLQRTAPLIAFPRGDEGDPHRRLLSEIPDQDSALSEGGPTDKPAGGHLHGIANRLIDRELAHISPRSIRKDRVDTDLQLSRRIDENLELLTRADLQPFELR